MSENITIFEEAAQYALSIHYEDITPEAMTIFRRSFLDCIGCMVASSTQSNMKALHRYIKESAGPEVSKIFGTGIRTTPLLAALANGTAAHLLDYDDNGSLIGHPAAVIMPAIFALADQYHFSGKELYTAYAAGYQTANCMMNPIERMAWFQGWHMTAIGGVLGAAVSAGVLLGLTEEQMVMALGLAASQASGFKSNFGTAAKGYQCGSASARGLEAALLAKNGFQASRTAAERDGWLKMYSGHSFNEIPRPTFDLEMGLVGIGTQYKPYPACGGSHTFLESAYELAVENDIDPREIDHVYVGMDRGNHRIMVIHDPIDEIGAGSCIEFCAVAPFVYRCTDLNLFRQEVVDDPLVKDLMKKVEYSYDPLFSDENLAKLGKSVGWHPSCLRVFMKDGRVYERIKYEAKGTPLLPLSDEDLFQKFTDCMRSYADGEKSARLQQMLWNLAECNDFTKISNEL